MGHCHRAWRVFARQAACGLERQGLQAEQWGIPALTGYTLHGDDPLVLKSFVTQEMLKKGYLAGNSVYVR